MQQIFLIEDDDKIAGSIQRYLSTWGYQVVIAQQLRNIMPEFSACQPHLVLLDLKLPFYNGFYWCTEIRKLSKVPIIFLSSASDSMNIVMAMNVGADDFIAKPFDLNVLNAKVQAILRRSYDFAGQTVYLSHGDLILNTADTSLTFRGQHIDLTKNDYRILQMLLEHKGSVVSRDALMTRLWESDCFIDENTLTVNVARLRKKLEAIGLPNLIVTKKGLGYLVES